MEKYGLSVILDSIHTGIMLIDAETKKIVDVNSKAIKMIGAPKDRIVGSHCHKFVCIAQEGKCPITDFGQAIDNSERILTNTNGEYLPVLKTVVPLELDGHYYLLESFSDISELKQTEEQLRKSEEQYRLLVSNIPGFVYKGYKDWSVDFIDNKVRELTGYDKEEFDARSLKWSDLIYKEDLEKTKKFVKHAISTGSAYVREYRIKTKSGQTIWIQDRGQIVYQKNGEADHFSGVFFDITKQKQAEDELKRNERYYRSILKFMHESIVVIGRNYKITDVNAAFLNVTGCSRNAVIGQYCYQVSHGYDKPCDSYGEDCKLFEVFETGEARQCLHEHVLANGSKQWVDISLSPLKDGSNKITHVIESARDVTRQKQVEEALRESEAKYRLLIQHIPQKIFIKDVNSVYVSCNEHYAQDLGIMADEIVGKTDYDFFLKELADQYKADDQRIIASGEQEILEERYTQNDKTIWVHTVKTPVHDSEGQITGVLGIFFDITDRKQAEENKKQIEAQLLQAEKMASIGQLAAGVAHEINNPTGFVSSNLKTLSDYIKDISDLTEEYRNVVEGLQGNTDSSGSRPEISEQLQRIKTLEEDVDVDFILNDILELIEESREGTERIKSIIQDLKDFAHPGEDKPKFADINQNLDSTVNVVWNELKYKAEVVKDYGELPEVHCYPQMLNQVFMNLLVNAAQAIEERGEIRIQTRADNGYVAIKISDTGSGIPKDHLSRIFDPFFTTKDVGKGTGLGLNVVYNIIQKHHGTIDVESEVGKGTTFIIRMAADNKLV